MELNLLQSSDSGNLPKVCHRRTFFCSPHSSRHEGIPSYIWPLLGCWIIAGAAGFPKSVPWNHRRHHHGLCWAWDGSKLKPGQRSQAPGDSSCMHGARFHLLVCSNFWVWLEVTVGHNGTRAELWERNGVRAESSRLHQLQGSSLISFNSSALQMRRLRPRESE